MLRHFRDLVVVSLSLSLALITPAPVFAKAAPLPAAAASATAPVSTTDLQTVMRNDSQLIYWSTLEQRNPLVGDFALESTSEDKPLWNIPESNSLVDQNPYFMRSQSWSDSAKGDCAEGVCFAKTAQGLTLQFAGVPKTLLLKEAMTPILDTDQYLFMSADNQDVFKAKLGENTDEPGEGFFFIAKKDLIQALQSNTALPIFFAPTVGTGWTGPQPHAIELSVGDPMAAQYIFPDRDGDPLTLDHTDIMALEKISRNNLQLAQAWAAIEGATGDRLTVLPKVGTTMTFGLQLTGQLPRFPQTVGERAKASATQIAHSILNTLLPTAEAHDSRIQSLREKLVSLVRTRAQTSWPPPPNSETNPPPDETETVLPAAPTALPVAVPTSALGEEAAQVPTWRRWLAPGILYAATFGLAAAAYQDVDWKALITSDMPARITHLSMIFGGVALTSYMLKIGPYKDKLARLYPVGPDSERMAAAKGFLTIFSQGLWTSFAGIGMLIRQICDFGKDRFFPNNKMVHKAWEWTMGFALKSSSSITTNWHTAKLGWIFGMADATMVAVDLLIFAPWLMNQWGMTDVGQHTVAYASAAVLSQFVIYAQVGPHVYAQDVKTIEFQSAENEARRQMIGQGLDPENSRNEGKLTKLTAIEMEKKFKAVGLPSDDEFFFDPLSIWLTSLKKLGYSADRLQDVTEEQREKLAEQDFILSHRHLGLIKPAMKSALAEAEKLNAANPTKTGERTITLLKWALQNRSLTKPMAGRVYDLTINPLIEKTYDHVVKPFTGRAYDQSFHVSGRFANLKESVNASVVDWLSQDKTPNFIGKYWAVSRGMFDYLAADATKVQRDLRSVLFTMSTSDTEAAVASTKFLPQSWIDHAGSEEAAAMGAMLFHRHYIGYIEKNIGRVQKFDEIDAEFGARADAQLQKMDAAGLSTDAFAKGVRRNMILTTLKASDDERKEIEAWKPKADDILGRRQWRIAQESADKVLPNPDDLISEEWISLTKSYAATLKPELAETFEAKQWVRAQQYRFTFAQSFAKQVGLHVNNVADSEFVQRVMVKAVQATDSSMRKAHLAHYHDKLDSAGREDFMARVFTENFINTYVGMSVNTDQYLKAASPEFPGRLQRARRYVLGKPYLKWMQKPLALAEMFGRNENTSYQPGIKSMLDRSLPVVPDLAHALVRTLRSVPYQIGPAYLTQTYIFQIAYPYVMWVATVLFGSTNGAFVAVNNRMMRNLDKKPMGGTAEKLLFARTHSLFTNPQAVLELMYAEPIVRGVNENVEAVLNRCEEVLRSVGKGISN